MEFVMETCTYVGALCMYVCMYVDANLNATKTKGNEPEIYAVVMCCKTMYISLRPAGDRKMRSSCFTL